MRSGFTLVETLVALGLLVAVSAALVALQVSGFKAHRAATELHQAARVLRDEVVLQRVEAGAVSGSCRSTVPAAVTACRVERACVDLGVDGGVGGGVGGAPCAVISIGVRLEVGNRAPLEVRSVVFPWLEGRP